MSKAAKDGNNFRREWDKEAFEKRAKERLEAVSKQKICARANCLSLAFL